MDQESNQMEQHPVQCRNGCGFYSNAGTEGLCSVCYKDMIKKKQQPPSGMPASLTPAPGAMASLSIDESSSSSSGAAAAGASNTSPALETASPTVILPSQSEKVGQGRSVAALFEALGGLVKLTFFFKSAFVCYYDLFTLIIYYIYKYYLWIRGQAYLVPHKVADSSCLKNSNGKMH